MMTRTSQSTRGRGKPQRFRAFVGTFAALMLAAAVAPVGMAADLQDEEDHRVYLLLVQDAPGSFDEVVQRFKEILPGTGWELLGEHEAGVNREKCEYRSHVLVLESHEYNDVVLQAGLRGAFATPVRVAVFEDEAGIHIGATNPLSLNRTMVAEEGMQEAFAAAAQSLFALGERAYPEQARKTDYGRSRDKGRIGRTMGIMAGGPFEGKITEVTRVAGADLMTVAGQIRDGMADVPGEWQWEAHPVFTLDASSAGFAVVGVTGDPIEYKSFDIVGAGGNDDRKSYACPGIDHAPAYPLEVVLAQEGTEVAIYMVNEMFRMKMYFEDAGRMAFARNMGMPGSIEDEIKDKVRAVVNQP